MKNQRNILARKSDHIDLVLEQAKQAGYQPNAFDQIRLVHNALPECKIDALPLETEFLGNRLKLPFLISSMTGGPQRAASINRHLAQAAQELGIALAVGSQRVALMDRGAYGLTSEIRSHAPDIPIFSNIGAAQLRKDFTLDDVKRAVEMIEADALIIHLNAMQEAIQDNGDLNWTGIERAIETVCGSLSVPVITKEVGMGISANVAKRLVNAGVSAIDVAGFGGTNFAKVEGGRANHAELQDLGEIFSDWGISTPAALMQIRAELPKTPLIASGGIRHGLDAAKSLRLGANLVAQAGPVLRAACLSTDHVVDHFKHLARTLSIALACSEDEVIVKDEA